MTQPDGGLDLLDRCLAVLVPTLHTTLPSPFERISLSSPTPESPGEAALPDGNAGLSADPAWVAWPMPGAFAVDHDAGDEDPASVAFRTTSGIEARITMNLLNHDDDPWLSTPLTAAERAACEHADRLVNATPGELMLDPDVLLHPWNAT